MSTYLVADETISLIADFCADVRLSSDHRLSAFGYGGCVLARALATPADRAAFAQELFEMNVAAVTSHYSTDQVEEMLGDAPFQYSLTADWPTKSEMWPVVLKAMDCYLYQCNEGDIDQRPLFKQMAAIRDQVALVIARATPGYEAAEWG